MRRMLALAVLVWLCAGWTETARSAEQGAGPFLAGRMLVAAEELGDPNFSRTVVYLIRHDADGAIGLITNRAIGEGDLNLLLKGFGLTPGEKRRRVELHFGGPVASGGAFILHTPDFTGKGTVTSPGGISMSGEKDVLEAIARGAGPRRIKVMIGYAGWGPGQLEKEIARGAWLDADADQDFLFGAPGSAEDQWTAARAKAGLTF